MAGFYFGKSRWDDLPQALGLAVAEGVMSGLWRGLPVDARFYNRQEGVERDYYRYTDVALRFDPPLGLQGLESAEPWMLIVDPALRADFDTHAKALGMQMASIGDGGITGTWPHYESGVERYRAAFDLFAQVGAIVLDRRAKNPPPWEVEIAATWPALARGWGMELDVRRASMSGLVRGRPTSVGVAYERGGRATRVEVALPFPPGFELSLARQDGDGFFARLFRGQDIVVGDPVFDASFIVKGKPEALVLAALTPPVREQILDITSSGDSITVADGKLIAWAREMITDRERLDSVMKAAFAAALALCPEPRAAGGERPYR